MFLTPFVSAASAARTALFERAAHSLERRDDAEGAALMRELGHLAPIVPFALSDAAVSAHEIEARRYQASRETVRRAILGPGLSRRDAERVERAEADLHVVAYELEKRDRAHMGDVRRFLDDAAWMLRGLRLPDPSLDEATARAMRALGDTVGVGPAVRVTRPAATPPRVALTAVPERIKPGTAVMLQWTTSGADTVTFESAAVRATGALLVSPDTTRIYSLLADGPGGRAHTSVLVTVLPHAAPRAALVASPPRIRQGENVYILWRASEAETVTLNGLRVPLQGTAIEMPATNVSYRLEAIGPGGRAEASASVIVDSVPSPAPPVTDTKVEATVEVRATERAITWFSFTGTRPDSATRAALDRIAARLKADSTARLLIVGHTDGVGSAAGNLRLSIRRALAARDWIARRYRLNRDRFEIEGRGESEPMVLETRADGTPDPEGRRMNRRIELILK